MLLSESPRKSFISSVIRLLVTVTSPFIARLVALDAHDPTFFVPYSDIVSIFGAFHIRRMSRATRQAFPSKPAVFRESR
jgi:hypothetical protein